MNNNIRGNEIDEIIDNVSQKFDYDEGLNSALKRIVPHMIEGKSDEVQSMLFDTLNRVKIFVLPYDATQEDVDKCQDEVFKKQDVTFIEQDRGEYGKSLAAGAYVNEPIFDENMNIVDRQSFIYVTKLHKYDSLSKIYETDINLSHLIHELGHAWAAEKDEFVQDENGNYVNKIGACKINAIVDAKNKTVQNINYDGLLIEEALNTIEEENVLCKMLNIQSINELKVKGYVPSNYQWFISDIMREHVEKFGQEAFGKYRYEKDGNALCEIEKALENTESMNTMKTDSYLEKKKAKFERINELQITERAKDSILNIVNTYRDDFFADNNKFTPFEKLENVFTQIYDMSSVKYNFGFVNNEINKEIYSGVITSIIAEGYVPGREAKEVVKEEKNIEESSFMNELKSNVKTAEEMATVKQDDKKYKTREIKQEKELE